MRGGGQRFNERGVKADHPKSIKNMLKFRLKLMNPKQKQRKGLVQGLQF